MKPPAAVRTALRDEGVDYVLVDWNWIDRYRAPGNYGYAEFVQPGVFRALQDAGVLRQLPVPLKGIELYRVIGEAR